MDQVQEVQVKTDTMETATRLINTTASHVFLTGKAGTGKTTFLRNLARHTHKTFAVVAPTGIAALNARGVTIHSQFLLPFGMFVPSDAISDDHGNSNWYNARTLARKHPLNSVRKQVLRSIDLLVIDEVSMLRADLLDAIDYRLKAARGNYNESFGGVQLLLIGDLYQLPPVIKREEESLLRKYYSGPWFFESLALGNAGFAYVELDKIFRQQDGGFIQLLNNLRNNCPTHEDIALLNSHYKAPESLRDLKEVITLTTHNYKAEEINRRKLGELPTPLHRMDAGIEGDFPESIHPVLSRLELKEGAQIMFVKNDNEGKAYFNGKLATVRKISGGEVTVAMGDDDTLLTLKKEVWENKRYLVDPDTKELSEEIVGTFTQYPVKLAWAITVHKSQGLTFDRAIIDVQQAFADGQVYVALSRLRSLDGLILRSRIDARVISTDKQVVDFASAHHLPEKLPELLRAKQREYLQQLVAVTYDFSGLCREIRYAMKSNPDSTGFEEKSMQPVLVQMTGSMENERENTQRFAQQLTNLLVANNHDYLFERIEKGSEYYQRLLLQQLQLLSEHTAEIRQLKKKKKAYLNALADLEQLFTKKLEAIDKARHLVQSILTGADEQAFLELARKKTADRLALLKEIQAKAETKSPSKKVRKPKKPKDDIRSTQEISVDLFKKGMAMGQIAAERGLALGTIEGHLAWAVDRRLIDVFSFIGEGDVNLITDAIRDLPQGFTVKDLFAKFEGKFSYGQLKAVLSHITALEETRAADG